MSSTLDGDILLGCWKATLSADPAHPAVSVVYEFQSENILVIHADGTPPAQGGYELQHAENPPRLNLLVPVSAAPLVMISIADYDGDRLRLRFIDNNDIADFLDIEHSTTEQLHLTRVDGPPDPAQLPPLQEPYASMTLEQRKRQCLQEYLSQSMSAGMQALQSPEGLGGALQSIMTGNAETLPSVAASKYFHSALQMGGQHALILYKYGFSTSDMQELLNDPSTQEAAQEAVMAQMAQMFGGDMGAFGELMASLVGPEGTDPQNMPADMPFLGGPPPGEQGQVPGFGSPDLSSLMANGFAGLGGVGGNANDNPFSVFGGGMGFEPLEGGRGGGRVEGLDDDDQDPDNNNGPAGQPPGCNPQ